MSELSTQLETAPRHEVSDGLAGAFRASFLREPLDRLALTLAIGAVPLSIAISESLLAVSWVARVLSRSKTSCRAHLSLSFCFWVLLAVSESASWLLSPDRKAGASEMRHLLLLASLGVLLPCLGVSGSRIRAWKAVLLSSGLSSIFLIGNFLRYVLIFHANVEAGGSARFYLRTGGFLGNWMVYATVEVIVFAGLLGFQAFYPEERKRWRPIWILNLIAIAVSLTRMLWAVCWLLAGIELARRRSKWLWPVAALPVLLYGMAPGPVRSRIRGAMNPDYYPNQERIEMLRVGWRMIKKHPWIGVGPGRISELYLQYLQPHEPIPRYRGHLHNNLVQVASTFGLPVALAAILFVFALYRDLFIALRAARGREESFCCLTSLLALTGFLIAGVFDYTYGHSLALILLSFAVLSPFVSSADSACGINDSGCSGKSKFTWAWIAQVCGFREVVQ